MRILIILAGLLALAGCGGSAHPDPSSTPAPASCAASPCNRPGTIRWSADLGLDLPVQLAGPAVFDFGETTPVFAAAGPAVIAGSRNTVIGLDATSGRQLWRTTGLVGSGQYVADIHDAGPLAVVTVEPRLGRGPGTADLIDPRTGAVRLRVPAFRGEGLAWSDGATAVALEPTALARIDVATGKAVWSVPLVPGRRGEPASLPPTSIVVAGDRVAYNVTGTNRAVDLRTGRPLPMPTGSGLFEATPSRVLDDGPATIVDAGSGRTLWTSPGRSDVQAVDVVAGTLYWVPLDGGVMHAVSLADGRAESIAKFTGLQFGLVGVHAGVAVYSRDSPSGVLPSSTYFVGYDVRTGRPKWSTYSLANLYYASTLAWPDAGGAGAANDFVGGFTCPDLRMSNPAKGTCPDVHLTLVNV